MRRACIAKTILPAFVAILSCSVPLSAETSSWNARVDAPKREKPKLKLQRKQAPPTTKPGVQAPLDAPEPSPTGNAKGLGTALPYQLEAPKDDTAATAYLLLDQGKYVSALRIALKAVEKREREAYTLIGRIYEEGLGVGQNQAVAAEWYKQGAELGDPNAQFAAGLMYAEGRGLGKNYGRAANAFEAAAKQGHEIAQYNLALLYVHGEGRPENFTQAAYWLEKSATAGYTPAQYDFATLLLAGTGVAENPDLAAQWMARAAMAGHPDAQLEYASMLAKGQGVAKDGRKAFEFIRRAAGNGNVVAQNRLARFYFYGVEVKADPQEGAKWHLIAREAGVSDGRLDVLLAQLSPDQRKAAEEAAAQWLVKSELR